MISKTQLPLNLYSKTFLISSAIVKDTSQSQQQEDSLRKILYSLSRTEEFLKDSAILTSKIWQPASLSSKIILSFNTGGCVTSVIDKNFKKETVKTICPSSKPKSPNGTERGINTSLILLTSIPLLILITCVIFLFLLLRHLQHQR